MSLTALSCPFFRRLTDWTGGRKLFAEEGNTISFIRERLSPVYGQRVPGFGRRMNSGVDWLAGRAIHWGASTSDAANRVTSVLFAFEIEKFISDAILRQIKKTDSVLVRVSKV